MNDHLPTGATIGILGGGQLGRMLSVAAARLGLRTHIFEPGSNPPAADVAHEVTTAAYDDVAALTAFAKAVDLVTYEFENIPTEALDIIEAITPIHPNRRALGTSQDRLVEKTFLQSIGLTVAPFADITDAASLDAAIATIAPAVLEGFVNFTAEISIIAARNPQSEVACYDPGENVHRDGILHTTTVPAKIPAGLRTDAVLLAAKILNTLDYVGVMGVELFVTPQGLIVNEIAPRVHNSGHWTQNGCAVDQFEQHIRAIAGWPLGDGSRHSDVVMENLIGKDVDTIPARAREPNCAIHLYGKTDVKEGRKMGHINRIT